MEQQLYGQGGEPPLVAIGDLTVTPHWFYVPRIGQWRPLAGTTWTVTDRTAAQTFIPAWAVVLAVLGIPFSAGLSLFFLLARATRQVGYVEVTVSGPGFFEATRVLVGHQFAASEVSNRVNYVRGLVASVN